MKVLIADDRESTRFMLRKYIHDWGDTPVEAVNGDSAWELLNHEEPPRIAILDWMMPGMNGVDICRRLSERENAPFIYAILLTSREAKEDLVYALNNGAHNFQAKPISKAALRSHINVGKRMVWSDDKLKEYAMKIENLALNDPLTGVSNRRHFMMKGKESVDVALRYGRPVSVLMMDLDHFKNTNDTWGHAAGDKALITFTDLCKSCIRNVDTLGRIGGEEFAVVLPETDTEAAYAVAERIRESAANMQIPLAQETIRMTVSIGVSCFTTPATDTIDTVLERADKALYRAKRQGRNQTMVEE